MMAWAASHTKERLHCGAVPFTACQAAASVEKLAHTCSVQAVVIFSCIPCTSRQHILRPFAHLYIVLLHASVASSVCECIVMVLLRLLLHLLIDTVLVIAAILWLPFCIVSVTCSHQRRSAVLCCRFVQSNAYLKFIERGGKLKYNEFGTARPALESLPVIAAGLLGIGQGKFLTWQLQTQCMHTEQPLVQPLVQSFC